MSDYERMNFTLSDGGELEGNKENVFLYTYLGKAALFNHVWVVTDDEENRQTGFHIWENYEPHSETYHAAKEIIEEHEYTQHRNMPNVAQCDERAFIEQNTRDIGDTLPEDWE